MLSTFLRVVNCTLVGAPGFLGQHLVYPYILTSTCIRL